MAHHRRRRDLDTANVREQRLRWPVLVQHGAARQDRQSRHRLSRDHPQLPINQRGCQLDRPDRRLGFGAKSAPGHPRDGDAPDRSGHVLHGNRRRALEKRRRWLELHQPQRQPQHVPVLRRRRGRSRPGPHLRRSPGQQFGGPFEQQRVVVADGHGRRLHLPHQSAGQQLLVHHVLPGGRLPQRVALDQRAVRRLRRHQRPRQRRDRQRPEQLGHTLPDRSA